MPTKKCPSCNGLSQVAKKICACGAAFTTKPKAKQQKQQKQKPAEKKGKRAGAGSIDRYAPPAGFVKADAPSKGKKRAAPKSGGGTGRPRGRPPSGKQWDEKQQQWVKDDSIKSSSSSSSSSSAASGKKKAKKAKKGGAYLHTARFGDSGIDLVGFRLCKIFDEGEGVVYEGTIRSVRKSVGGEKLYHVEYDDGDKEDLTLTEMVEAHNNVTKGAFL